MHETEQGLESNPGRALAVRIFVGCIAGVLVYAALPHPFEASGWWANTAHLPFFAGVAALLFSFFAPAKWCEALVLLT